MKKHSSKYVLLMSLVLLVGCDQPEEKPKEKSIEMKLIETSFSELPDWKTDDLQTFVPAFARSCSRILDADEKKQFLPMLQAGTYDDWQGACQKFLQIGSADTKKLRQFFEENFVPHLVQDGDNPIGLFTGYYEASLQGSRTRTDLYTTPLYIRPYDLVMVDLGLFREEHKGQRIAGRVEQGNLKPYESRADIVAGNWPHNDKVLVWVDDPVDAFFVQIQGSGLVTLSDGSTMRIGYAGQNGHPYFAIGKELIARGELTKEEVSMQSIRAWLETYPQQADEIMNTNKSYVFFQEQNREGPLGAEGVELTPQRSLAVDRTLVSYGLPLWVDIEHPDAKTKPIRRLMIAQDTGGAITGAVRGDVFWGHGAEAEAMAGKMKSKGKYWVFLPRNDKERISP